MNNKNKQDQNIDVDIEGNISGDIHIDRHDSHVDQSVSEVTAGEDAIIATGRAQVAVKKTFVQVIPSWMWIVILLVVFGGSAGVWVYRYVEHEKLKKDLEFEKNETGILVANLKPRNGSMGKAENRGIDFAQEIYYSLKGDEDILGDDVKKVEVKHIDPRIIPYIDNESDAEKIGKTYNASLVIWGHVNTELDIFPFVQPILSTDKRYDLVYLTLTPRLDTVEYKLVAETVKRDVQKLVAFIKGYISYMESKDLEDLKNSITYFQNAVGFKEKINNAYTHFYLGNAYYFSGNEREAETEYQEAVKLKKNFMEALNNLGFLALSREDIEDAVKYFLRANKYGKCSDQIDESQESSLNPGCVHLIYNLGTAYTKNGEYEKAIDYYNKLSKEVLDSVQEGLSRVFLAQVYNNMGYLYIQIAKKEQKSDFYEEAKAYLDNAMGILNKEAASISSEVLRAERARVNRNLARLALERKDWDIAENHLMEAKKEVNHPDVYLLLAQLYDGRCTTGDRDKIAEEKERYLALMLSMGKMSEAIVKLKELKSTCSQ